MRYPSGAFGNLCLPAECNLIGSVPAATDPGNKVLGRRDCNICPAGERMAVSGSFGVGIPTSPQLADVVVDMPARFGHRV